MIVKFALRALLLGQMRSQILRCHGGILRFSRLRNSDTRPHI